MNFTFYYLILTLVFRLILSYYLPLIPDEAYYWTWSKNIQLSYFDHPGMVAWLFKIGALFEPYGHAVRWPAVIMSQLTTVYWIYILKELDYSQENIKVFLLISIINPVLGIGSIIVTPDLPVLFFWSASLYYFIKILNSKKLFHYIALGVNLGLGFNSKYHIVLFVLFGLIYICYYKLWKKLSLKGVLLTILFGFLFSLPVLIWNYQNNFKSFKFQISHGLENSEINLKWPLEYLLGQCFLLMPPFTYYFFKANIESKQKILYFFSLSPILFFLFTSFRAPVEMNWTLISFSAFYAVVSISPISKKWLNGTLAMLALLQLITFVCIKNKIYLHGKIMEPFFFESQKDLTKMYQPIYGINYQISSSLWYFSKIKTPKIPFASRFDFFDYQKIDLSTFPKSFYVVKEKRNEYPDWITALKPKYTFIKQLNDVYLLEKVEL